jgi:hypothetical protein
MDQLGSSYLVGIEDNIIVMTVHPSKINKNWMYVENLEL